MTHIFKPFLVCVALSGASALAQTPKPTQTPRPTPRPKQSSLAEAVRRSQQRTEPQPEKKKKSLGTISNDTLKTKDGKKQLNHVSGDVSVPKSSSASAPEAAAQTDANGMTEQDWKQRAASLKASIAEGQKKVRDLETETKRLENDFYAWSDGNYRDTVIKPSWDKAKEDLKAARAQLEQSEASVSSLEDDARKAGAPPGWVR